METSFFLVNHTRCEASDAGTLKGQKNVPLTAEGIQESHALAGLIKERHFDAILSSDLAPAWQTAQILACDLSLKHVVSKEIRLRYSGIWAGKAIDLLVQVQNKLGKTLGREDDLHIELRIFSALKKLARAYPGKTFLWVVNHTVITALESYFSGSRRGFDVSKLPEQFPFLCGLSVRS